MAGHQDDMVCEECGWAGHADGFTLTDEEELLCYECLPHEPRCPCDYCRLSPTKSLQSAQSL